MTKSKQKLRGYKAQISFTATDELRDLIQNEADRRGTSVSNVIRERLLKSYGLLKEDG